MLKDWRSSHRRTSLKFQLHIFFSKLPVNLAVCICGMKSYYFHPHILCNKKTWKAPTDFFTIYCSFCKRSFSYLEKHISGATEECHFCSWDTLIFRSLSFFLGSYFLVFFFLWLRRTILISENKNSNLTHFYPLH